MKSTKTFKINDTAKDVIDDVHVITDDVMIRKIARCYVDAVHDDRGCVEIIEGTETYDEAKYFITTDDSYVDDVVNHELTVEDVDELISYLTRIRKSIAK